MHLAQDAYRCVECLRWMFGKYGIRLTLHGSDQIASVHYHTTCFGPLPDTGG